MALQRLPLLQMALYRMACKADDLWGLITAINEDAGPERAIKVGGWTLG